VTAKATESFLDDLRALSIEVDAEGSQYIFDRVADLARRNHLTIYDAAYLELALRTGLPLATQDRELRAAAQAEGALLA
jgi:predicted nucleic acid-binding protein